MKRITLVLILLSLWHAGSSTEVFFNVLDYGAVNTGQALTTSAIQKAIDECAGKGGGTVLFPAGKYISGTIFLKSFVTLHLESGAVLAGSTNLADYPVTIAGIRSYTDNYTCRSLIYAENQESISITGQGILDGNGSSFQVSDELRRSSLFESYKARPYMIRFIHCSDVQLRNITLKNSPMWVQHYLSCSNVVISGITVDSRVNRNNDGIDIDACENVRISDCEISSGDDAIVLKSTCGKLCKNVVITNCILSSECNAFKLGTESNGGFENISFSNSVVYNTDLAGIAIEMVDGGTLSNVIVSGINMDSVGCALFVRLGNRARPFLPGQALPGTGQLSGLIISAIQATNVGIEGCSFTGLPSFPVMNITLRDIRLAFAGGGTTEHAKAIIEELPAKYPEFDMFGILPAYGLYFRHARGVTLDHVVLDYRTADYRPAVYLNDVDDASISGLKAESEKETESIFVVDNSRDVVMNECYRLKNNGLLLTLRNGSKNIIVKNSLKKKR